MFVLSVLYDTIPIDPLNFYRHHKDYLQESVQNLYVDRVIAGVGLVIAFYDFVSIEDAKIYNGDSRVHFKTTFRVVVFQPHIGEILQGVITENDSLGLQVSLDFFSDVRILSSLLREPKGYDKEEKTWHWNFEGHKLPYTTDSVIRFRVVDVCYNQKERVPGLHQLNPESQDSAAHIEDIPPMTILGSVTEDGLGLRCWWE